ncbi:MAG: 50S ribosomal protein L3 N(5)-glutamine methyltransferase [Parvularculaceae bacterium]|nr:50S ribosomal protein L3 N(5)-glutamine methyltransferase [Parvularculaceae bacterium]
MSRDLTTVRDFFRYAVSEFTRAELSFGHGAVNAIDEAAFIVLESLALPIDDINPWLDARLTGDERVRLADLIRERIEARKPAAYLLNKAYIQGVPFYVDERVIVPRSYIGEIIAGGAGAPWNGDNVNSVLDLCTGSGCLAIIAALAFPEATVDAVDISGDAIDVARRNVVDHGLSERISLHAGDLFAPVGARRFDIIISNPPYVDAQSLSAFPPEYRAEPMIAHAGGDDGLEIVRRILAAAPAHLNDGGGLLCEIGSGRELLEAAYPRLPFLWIDTQESEGEVFWLARADFG